MEREKLTALIDRVIGKKGILRAPSYWMSKVLHSVMDYADVSASASEKKANQYTDESLDNYNLIKYYVLPTDLTKYFQFPDGTHTYSFTREEGNQWLEFLQKTSPDFPLNYTFVCKAVGEVRLSHMGTRQGDDVYIVYDNITKREDRVSIKKVTITISHPDTYSVQGTIKVESCDVPISAKVEEMLAERIGDIDSILDSINGEEV